MSLAGVKPEALVNKRGREFVALVDDEAGGHMQITPLDRRVSYRSATAREVIGHWSKHGRSRVPDLRATHAIAA